MASTPDLPGYGNSKVNEEKRVAEKLQNDKNAAEQAKTELSTSLSKAVKPVEESFEGDEKPSGELKNIDIKKMLEEILKEKNFEKTDKAEFKEGKDGHYTITFSGSHSHELLAEFLKKSEFTNGTIHWSKEGADRLKDELAEQFLKNPNNPQLNFKLVVPGEKDVIITMEFLKRHDEERANKRATEGEPKMEDKKKPKEEEAKPKKSNSPSALPSPNDKLRPLGFKKK